MPLPQGDDPGHRHAETEHLERLAGLLHLSPTSRQLTGSRSGAHVHRVVMRDGTPAVLKLTIAGQGAGREAAERELAFYREVAPHLTLRTPTLLGAHCDVDAVAVVLTAHDRLMPAADWTHDHWSAMAADLAVLHEFPVPQDDRWRQSAGPLAGADHLRAEAYWSAENSAAPLTTLLQDPSALIATADRQSLCFGHGDCHADNVLVDDSTLIWTDWQQVGVGRPAYELAFPSVRATPEGAVLPLADMISLYAGRRDLDPIELRTSVVAAELAIFLLAWPPYAAFITTAGVQRVHRRVEQLVRRWFDLRSRTP